MDDITFSTISIDPQNKFFSTKTIMGNLDIWKESGNIFRSFRGKNSAAFSPNGKLMVVGGNQYIHLYNNYGRLLRRIPIGMRGAIMHLQFTPDSKQFISNSFMRVVTVWSTSGKKIYQFNNLFKKAWCMALSPDGKYLLFGTYNEGILLYTLKGKHLKTFKGHQDLVPTVAWNPKGKYFASGSKDGTVKLWSVSDGCLHTFKEHTDKIRSVTFTPDGKFVMSGSRDGTVRIWNINTKKHITLFLESQDSWFVHDEKGNFDGSAQGVNKINLMKGMVNLSESKETWNNYFTPGLLRKFLNLTFKKKKKKKIFNPGYIIGRIWNIRHTNIKVAVRNPRLLRPGQKLKVYWGRRPIYLTVSQVFHTSVLCRVSASQKRLLRKYAFVYR